ncbi:hypothetical protein Nepgr_010500 [Nepenthes gracilis]|uniref:Transmembrane protein n=1 Tax=Nepenthes gracilis TaxID=150966 RepID=A0AAD3SCJ0_NEPGR|nr:hypothetical protein Nepgr_010500 [Nepenthes gracilis]
MNLVTHQSCYGLGLMLVMVMLTLCLLVLPPVLPPLPPPPLMLLFIPVAMMGALVCLAFLPYKVPNFEADISI